MPALDLSDLSRSLVIAHRGANAEAPENTLLAFELAIEAGADLVEFDVHVAADGEIVVMHDSSVRRTTDGHGKVQEMSVAELKQLDAGAGQPVPTLQEVINLCKNKIGLCVEVKDKGMAGPLVEAIRVNGIRDAVLVCSFHHRELRAIRELDKLIPVATLEPKGSGWATAWVTTLVKPHKFPVHAKWVGAACTHPFYPLVKRKMVEKATDMGIRVHPWTVDAPKRLLKLKKRGVHGVITNDPRLARSYF